MIYYIKRGLAVNSDSIFRSRFYNMSGKIVFNILLSEEKDFKKKIKETFKKAKFIYLK